MKSFGHYKNSIDSILENSFKDSKVFKKNLSVIMGAMKYSKVLREFFTLYNEIDSKNFKTEEESKEYLNESIGYLKTNRDKLKKALPILNKIVEDRKELCTKKINPIYENIDNIVFNNTIVNLEKISKSKKFLGESMVGLNQPASKIKNPKILSHVLSKKYGEEYNTELTETQQKILKNTLLMTEDTLTNEFTNIKEITLNKINSILKESKDDNLSIKLVEVKNEISGLDVTKKSYIKVRSLLEDLN
jgi:hypothetical protein|tara:strand:+ start:224 stop:964 length:741 start_codon:yes stop_codon:yes gene_type:complete